MLQDEIVREAQTMRQQSHPCVLPLYCSFVHEQNLWMVMPYVAGGSVLNIMKYAYPEVRRLLFLLTVRFPRHALLVLAVTYMGYIRFASLSCAGIGGASDCHNPEGSPEGLGVHAQAGRYPSGCEGTQQHPHGQQRDLLCFARSNEEMAWVALLGD